jgi:hypothetical protein
MSGTILDAALHYAALDWSIIPIREGTKKPTCPWTKYQTERATETQLTKWFGNGREVGLAVVFGPVSGGLVCRDFDTMAGYQRWAADHPGLAATLPTVATARGRHVYFRVGPDDLVFADLGDGEYRGDNGHYCLLPPSLHPEGPEYTWLVPLPDGPMPFIEDVRAVGLLLPSPCYTESAAYPCNELAEEAVSSVSLCVKEENEEAVSSVYQGVAGREKGVEDRIGRMIRGCLPTGPGRRNRQVFELARAIKAQPDLADAAPDDLLPIVKRWHTLALPNITTKEFAETWIDFLQAWPRVKIPKGATMMSIMRKALECPMPKAAARYEEEPLRRLVALCCQLDREANGGRFFLSCRTAGKLLGVTHVQANRWLFLLDHDKVVKQLNKGDRARRQAAEYRYLGDTLAV